MLGRGTYLESVTKTGRTLPDEVFLRDTFQRLKVNLNVSLEIFQPFIGALIQDASLEISGRYVERFVPAGLLVALSEDVALVGTALNEGNESTG